MNEPGAAALHLLFGLIEAPKFAVTRASVDYHGVQGGQLVETGLLVPAGYENTITDEDDDDRPRLVGREGERGLGYHSSFSGWTSVEQEKLVFYEPDLRRLFQLLFGNQINFGWQAPFALDGGKLIWEIGTAYIGGRNCSIWFARRLAQSGSASSLLAEHDARPPGDMRIVLTSTSRDRLPTLKLLRGTMVFIADALLAIDGTHIDLAVLAARIAGRPVEKVSAPVQLSADDSTLFIHGEKIVCVGGKKQRQLLRLLVDAHQQGQSIRAAAVMQKAGFSGNSFDKAFGNMHWPELRKYLRSSGGVWTFQI